MDNAKDMAILRAEAACAEALQLLRQEQAKSAELARLLEEEKAKHSSKKGPKIVEAARTG
jgi:hypothetical protein